MPHARVQKPFDDPVESCGLSQLHTHELVVDAHAVTK